MLLVSIVFYGLSFAYISIHQSSVESYSNTLKEIDFKASQSECADSVMAYLEEQPSKPFAKFANNEKKRIITNNLIAIEALLNGEINYNSKTGSYLYYQRFIWNIVKYPFPVIPTEYHKFMEDYSKTRDIFQGFDLVSELIREQIKQSTLDDELINMSKNTLKRLQKPEIFFGDEFMEEQWRISNEVE
ncbi:MAG: hypothetical protein R2883_07235 [Caldisericia bacterium]